jgi:hypothetical protein
MDADARRTALRLVATGIVCWACAGACYAGLRQAFGHRPAYVHVRWAPTVDEATRARLETRYTLAAPEPKAERTFGYALTNVSGDNVRALVLDPAVEDTHQIHRTAFRIGYFTPRLPYLTAYPAIPVAMEGLIVLALLFGCTAFAIAAMTAWAPRLVRGPVVPVRRGFLEPAVTARGLGARMVAWVAARIPDGTAESAALFRVAFGSALMIFVLQRPVPGSWAVTSSNVVSTAQAAALGVLAETPWIAMWLAPWIAFWGLLFLAGAFARTAFACLTAGIFAWAVFYTTRTTYHTVSALLVTLLVLQWGRWSDAWSVDAWRGKPNRAAARPQRYGFTTWAPALVLGVVFAAAAVAKLRDSGLPWILNGTVKYHFLSDSPQAMVSWGLWIGQHHWLSVLFSFAAIAIESAVLVGVLAGAYRYRLAAGIAALALLVGFMALQGIFWPAWWILLLGFVPWHLVPARSSTAGSSARGWHATAAVRVVIALIAVQACVSLFRLEMSPLISTYDMYSTTYGSPAEYEQKAGQSYWVVASGDADDPYRCRITRVDAERITRAGDARTVAADPVMRECLAGAGGAREVSLEATRVQIDWDAWRRLERPRSTHLMGPVMLDLTP